MTEAEVQAVRRFNREVAQRIGALTDRFLGRGRPMGEARILWEIGSAGTDVRELRARLALDSGYTSRVLRSLERQGLVSVGSSPDDRRVRRVELTESGSAERAELDRRSDEVAAGILEALDESDRARLVGAMRDVERLLRASAVRLTVETPTSADARWCLERYFAELDARFEAGFDPARSISADASELTRPRGMFLVARLHRRPVGCGALKLHAGKPSELKRMWVSPDARGIGVGRRILAELERLARAEGVEVLRLETNKSLVEAIALYRSSGFREVPAFNSEPYAHHWFEKRLVPSPDDAR
ncbi:MAG TPA: bifunctional helix-turn-helix transcriptional regulator/GNAT family N-acetyltransferase [Candidatus Limnocylindrales bacterium]